VWQKPKISQFPKDLEYSDQGNNAGVFIYVNVSLLKVPHF
jgi:hypothetical protein